MSQTARTKPNTHCLDSQGVFEVFGLSGVKSWVIVCSLDITSKGLYWLFRLSIGFYNDFRAVFAVHCHLTETRTDE